MFVDVRIATALVSTLKIFKTPLFFFLLLLFVLNKDNYFLFNLIFIKKIIKPVF
jgi:hypothetical protein